MNVATPAVPGRALDFSIMVGYSRLRTFCVSQVSFGFVPPGIGTTEGEWPMPQRLGSVLVVAGAPAGGAAFIAVVSGLPIWAIAMSAVAAGVAVREMPPLFVEWLSIISQIGWLHRQQVGPGEFVEPRVTGIDLLPRNDHPDNPEYIALYVDFNNPTPWEVPVEHGHGLVGVVDSEPRDVILPFDLDALPSRRGVENRVRMLVHLGSEAQQVIAAIRRDGGRVEVNICLNYRVKGQRQERKFRETACYHAASLGTEGQSNPTDA